MKRPFEFWYALVMLLAALAGMITALVLIIEGWGN